jgi:hypothetical protein
MTWAVFLIPIVTIIAVFTFVAIATWSDNRRKEREAFYRHDTYRKLLEQSGDANRELLELMRLEDAREQRKRIDGMRLGGLITTAVGIGLIVFLFPLVEDEPVYLVGLIPLLIGLVLTFYGFFMLAKPNGDESRS